MIVEFECKECKLVYEELVKYDSAGKYEGVKCPKCLSYQKEKLVSLPSRAVFKNPVGTDLYESSHNYRAMHEIEKSGGARDQRKAAEEISHMGPSPYPEIDDINNGNYFGEVK